MTEPVRDADYVRTTLHGHVCPWCRCQVLDDTTLGARIMEAWGQAGLIEDDAHHAGDDPEWRKIKLALHVLRQHDWEQRQ